MSLKVSSRITYGNASAVNVKNNDDIPEVLFTAAPQNSAEALWFCFELIETEPDNVTATKVKITLKHLRNLAGCTSAVALKPVYHPKDQQWFRMKAGHSHVADDGQTSVSWTIPYPSPSTVISFCYPYGRPELTTTIQKAKGYWHQDAIGISQQERNITRLSNSYGKVGGHQAGIYIIARQNAGGTPGSWVLDGMLQQFSRNKKHNLLIWIVPLANIDGIIKGDYGQAAGSMSHAWGEPATKHETILFQNDIKEWKERCKPYLILDLHAAAGSEADGIYSTIPDPEQFAEANREASTWANVFKQALGTDYAAEEFKQTTTPTTTTVNDFARDNIHCTSITLNIPYANCGKTIMQQKQYREAGKRLADAILNRNNGDAKNDS